MAKRGPVRVAPLGGGETAAGTFGAGRLDCGEGLDLSVGTRGSGRRGQRLGEGAPEAAPVEPSKVVAGAEGAADRSESRRT